MDVVEILKELGNLAERGPIVVSLIAFGTIVIVIKMVMPVTREAVTSNTKLAGAIDRLSDMCSGVKGALGVVEVKVDAVHEAVGEIVDTVSAHAIKINEHDVKIDDHEGRIYGLEEKVK